MHTPDRLAAHLAAAPVVLSLLLAIHSGTAHAGAQTGPEQELASAKQAYANEDFSRALTLLHRATARIEQSNAANRNALLLDSYFFLGLTQHALSDSASALESFRMLLQVCPDCEIDAARNDPEVVALYQRAGGTSRGTARPTAPPRQRQQPRTTQTQQRPPPVRSEPPPPGMQYPKGDFAIGYSFLNLRGIEESLPVGINFGAAYNFNETFGLAFDIGANVKSVDDATITFSTFGVGPRFNFRRASTTSFAHVLFGAATLSVDAPGLGISGSGYLIQIGGGAQFRTGPGNLRVQFDYLEIEDSDGGLRFSVDYVIGFGEGN